MRRRSGSSKKLATKTTKLMALSSAAVLSVYGVGYVKTKSAADQAASAEGRRRSAGPRGGGEARDAVISAAPTGQPDAALGPNSASSIASMPGRASDVRLSDAAVRPPAAGATESRPAPGSATNATATKAHADVPVPTLATPIPDPPILTAVQGTLPAISSLTGGENVALPEPPPKRQYKDGTYLGWGSCRHGDIQAAVTILDDRIVSATINQCWTRYSCRWLDPVVPQVVARQSPNVDYVSGATQSVDAFYYAVVDALNKAK